MATVSDFPTSDNITQSSLLGTPTPIVIPPPVSTAQTPVEEKAVEPDTKSESQPGSQWRVMSTMIEPPTILARPQTTSTPPAMSTSVTPVAPAAVSVPSNVVYTSGVNPAPIDFQITVIGESFLLSGKSIDSYRSNINALGGRWNRDLSGYLFSNQNKKNVDDFIDSVKKGMITPNPAVPRPKKNHNKSGPRPFSNAPIGQGVPLGVPVQQYSNINTNTNVPQLTFGSIDTTQNDRTHQNITYRSVFNPIKCKIAIVKVGSYNYTYNIKDFHHHGHNCLDHVRVTDEQGILRDIMVECGQWQMKGLVDRHNVFFQ